ncbi:MAG: hypothetical protein JWR69_3936, partial [Pedosphaera sp.]|nr:hypothetical protein [Pedosphaera sp.]
MDDLKRCLEVLGLKPGATEEEVKQAYRELAMVWHPDRFASDSPLQAKANAKLTESNAAYEFLMAHGFKDGVPIIPEQPILKPDPSTASADEEPMEEDYEPPAGRSKGLWILLAVVLAAGSMWWWFQHREKTSSSQTVQNRTPDAVNPPTHIPVNPDPITPAKEPAVRVSTNDLLPSMRAYVNSKISIRSEGMVITGEGGLVTRVEYSPPFVIRAVAKTDLTNIRLVYGQGLVIFNWELNPAELRFHDPGTGKPSGVPGQGRVPVNEWQEIEWRVESNSASIAVNGTQRAKFSGNYTGINELV